MSQSRKPQLSIVICTHNRAEYLRLVLASLAEQSADKDMFEVLIVDNRSTDHTLQVYEDAGSFGLSLHYIHESKLGVSNARNRGLREGRADVIAYIDDDAIAERDWVSSILNYLQKPDPKLGALGGPIAPIWKGAKPAWADSENEIALSYMKYGDQRVELDESHSLFGSNIAYPRHVLEGFGGFQHQLGRAGASLLGCEESYLEKQIRRAGLKMIYEPSMKVRHHIHADRLSDAWVNKRALGQGASLALMDMLMEEWGFLGRMGRAFRRGIMLVIPPVRTLMRRKTDPHRLRLWKRNYYLRVGYVSGLLGLHRLLIRERAPD